MTQKIRVRFAPSPTGYLHIGSLRTALFNWLFARHNNGAFLMRIEDTDRQRSFQEFTDSIMQGLAWTEIASDEPLVIQSQNLAYHKKLIAQLLDAGKAYRCFCESNPMASEETYFKYDGRCRVRSVTDTDLSKPFAIRIKIPLEQKRIEFNDLIRGHVSFDVDQLDDFIIARSDGSPVYNFVVVADDALMKITHVIRGEDHISNTPKQIVIYQALSLEQPLFAHLPLILGPHGGKLSKRDAATSVLDYKKNGYLPEALCNYLVRLGWAYGDQEIFTRHEMVQYFKLDDVGKKGAMFDQDKLDWMNSIYIRQATPESLFERIIHDIEPSFVEQLSTLNRDQIIALIALYKERVKTLREMINELYNLYQVEHVISAEDRATWLTQDTKNTIAKVIAVLEELQSWGIEACSTEIKQWCKNNAIKLVQVAQPIRLALVGKTASPGVFELLTILGKQESMKRLKQFLVHFG